MSNKGLKKQLFFYPFKNKKMKDSVAFFAYFTISGTEKLVQFIGTRNFMKEEIKMHQDGVSNMIAQPQEVKPSKTIDAVHTKKDNKFFIN